MLERKSASLGALTDSRAGKQASLKWHRAHCKYGLVLQVHLGLQTYPRLGWWLQGSSLNIEQMQWREAVRLILLVQQIEGHGSIFGVEPSLLTVALIFLDQ